MKAKKRSSSMGGSSTAAAPSGESGVCASLSCTRRDRIRLLLFFALVIAYSLRVILSVAIISIAKEAGYTNEQEGIISAAFFVGYLILQLPGGWLAGRIGGWTVLGLGVLLPSLVTLATPPVATSYAGLITMRILTGLFEGVTYPCVHALASAWTPASERSRFIGSVWSGAFAGTVIALPASGVLIAEAGWPSVFYVFGGAGVVWAAAWAALGASSPEQAAGIDPAELAHIAATRGSEDAARRRARLPWRAIFSLPAVWAIAIQHATHNYMFYMLLTWLPNYLNQQLGFDVENSGVLAVVPYMACFLASNAAGVLADAALARGATPRSVRVASQFAAEVVPAATLLAVGFITDVPAVLTLLTLSVGFGGFQGSGFAVNHLDIAPHIAGVLMGVGNTLATVSGIIAPIIVGALVAKPHDDAAHWRIAFALAAGIAVAGFLVFAACARGERQPQLDFVQGEEDEDYAAAKLVPHGGADDGYAVLEARE